MVTCNILAYIRTHTGQSNSGNKKAHYHYFNRFNQNCSQKNMHVIRAGSCPIIMHWERSEIKNWKQRSREMKHEKICMYWHTQFKYESCIHICRCVKCKYLWPWLHNLVLCSTIVMSEKIIGINIENEFSYFNVFKLYMQGTFLRTHFYEERSRSSEVEPRGLSLTIVIVHTYLWSYC